MASLSTAGSGQSVWDPSLGLSSSGEDWKCIDQKFLGFGRRWGRGRSRSRTRGPNCSSCCCVTPSRLSLRSPKVGVCKPIPGERTLSTLKLGVQPELGVHCCWPGRKRFVYSGNSGGLTTSTAPLSASLTQVPPAWEVFHPCTSPLAATPPKASPHPSPHPCSFI